MVLVAFCSGLEAVGFGADNCEPVLGVLLAVGLMIVGIGLTMMATAAPVGIPIAILGSLLMIRSVF